MPVVRVGVSDAPYDVVIETSLLDAIGPLLTDRVPASAYAVISDDQVAPLYGQAVVDALGASGQRAFLLTFPAGEQSKTRETWQLLTDALLEHGLGRDGAVIGVGGGVVGDLAGFVAATYHRGVPHAEVPTTLLAMVDAAVGGKTGVDTPRGKNLVGAFHQPRVVVVDPATLRTLARTHLRAGAAEAIKHGVIADAQYLARLESLADRVLEGEAEALTAVVHRSVEIKAAIVAADHLERGRRAVLNFGHTIAHALEATANFSVLHGEAVALGMVLEARLAEHLGVGHGLMQPLTRTLGRYDLPAPLTAVAPRELLRAMKSDKKVRANAVRFALPKRAGEMATSVDGQWTLDVPEATLMQFLDKVL